ncbi:MAG: NAD(P)-dependent oxidoreductase [Actinomycetota bacterium]|nr:NAD(P)-dependent oxidoreductase [Actinomycetota bacterium]
MKVAFCGLGQMGTPMALRLLDAGHDLTVYNRTTSKTNPLRDAGAAVATSPRHAADDCEVAITMLSDPRALEDVVLGDEALATALGAGDSLVEMSTVGPETVRRIRRSVRQDVAIIDAPVLGSVPQAEAGELKIFVGGEQEHFFKLRALLQSMGELRHVGPLGSGAAMKLVTNSTLGALMSALGEALALADGLGLDQQTVLEVLAESPIGTTAARKKDNITAGKYPPNFKLRLAAKDMALVEEAARRAGTELKLATAAHHWFEGADRARMSELDYSAVTAYIRGLSP